MSTTPPNAEPFNNDAWVSLSDATHSQDDNDRELKTLTSHQQKLSGDSLRTRDDGSEGAATPPPQNFSFPPSGDEIENLKGRIETLESQVQQARTTQVNLTLSTCQFLKYTTAAATVYSAFQWINYALTQNNMSTEASACPAPPPPPESLTHCVSICLSHYFRQD